MAKFICPKCKAKECIVDSGALAYDDLNDLDISFKCYACKETFVAKYKIHEFWQIDKKIVKEYHEWKQTCEEKPTKKIKESEGQIKLF